MAYSYSDWANEFASVEEKKEKPGLGERSTYDQPAKSNSPTFVQTVAENYNDNTDDRSPVITEKKVKPSAITTKVKENTYVKGRDNTRDLQERILTKLIKTNTTPHTQKDMLEFSADSDDVFIIDNSIVNITRRKTPKFIAFLNGTEESAAYLNSGPPTLDIPKKESDDALFRRWDYAQKVIDTGKYGDYTEKTTYLSDPLLFEYDFQAIFDIYDPGGGDTRTNSQRLRDIERGLKADGTSVADIVREAVDQYKWRRDPKNPYGIGSMYGEVEPPLAVKAVTGVSEFAAGPGKTLKKQIDKIFPSSKFKFSPAEKPTSNSFLQWLGQDSIPNIGGSRFTFTDQIGKTDFEFSASQLFEGLFDVSDYNFVLKSLGGGPTITKNASGVSYDVPGVPILDAPKAGVNITGSASSDFGVGAQLDINRSIGDTPIDFKGSLNFNRYGKESSASLSYKKSREFSNVYRDKATVNYGLNANLLSDTLTASLGANFESGSFDQWNAGINADWTTRKGVGVDAFFIKQHTADSGSLSDSILNPLTWVSR